MSTYFDNGATTYLYPEVIDKVCDMMKNHWYNPNSLYSLGVENRKLIEQARDDISRYLHCIPSEIIFTSSASESNAFVINNFNTCYASPYNHHDIKDNIKTTVWWDKKLPNCSSREQNLFAIPFVNNETGEIFDVEYYSNLAHNNNMKILVDGTQALGNLNIYPHELGIDFMSFSLHKAHGPKVGLLYIDEIVQRSMKLKPLIFGTQESHLRGSTEDTANIVGGALAVRLADNEVYEKEMHCKKLKRIIINTLRANNVDFIINEGISNVGSILNLCFKNIIGEVLMLMLDDKGFYVSVGAACDSGNQDPSETLLAMGVGPEYISGELRISMSLQNSEEDAKNLATAIVECYNQLNGGHC